MKLFVSALSSPCQVRKSLNLRAALLVAVFVLLVSNPVLSFALKEGDHAPDFTLSTKTGQKISLADFKGKFVLVDIWASWCSSCAGSLPWINALQKRFGQDRFQVFAVNVDAERADADALLSAKAVDLLVGYDPDGKVPELLNVTDMPTSYLLDPTGKIIAIHRGLDDNHRRAILKVLEEGIPKGV